MALLAQAQRDQVLRILTRHYPSKVGAFTKAQIQTFIGEVDTYCDAMNATRPATSLTAACTAPFNGTGAGFIAARELVSGVVQAMRGGLLELTTEDVT